MRRCFEGMSIGPEINEVGIRKRAIGIAGVGVGRVAAAIGTGTVPDIGAFGVGHPVKEYELFGMADGKASEHDGVDECEDGSVCAYAQCESEDGDCGESGAAAKLAEGVGDILNKTIKQTRVFCGG